MDKRIIILEGCDRTGKSTFIEYLANNLKKLGKTVLIFHLLGPTKFQNLSFNNDDKSLIQLAKFDDEYTKFEEMLNNNNNLIIILDRSHFSEIVWATYWNRTGKYTNYLISQEFINKHKNFFDKSIYIDYIISDINILSKRIEESQEDTSIFTINNKSIKENINIALSLYTSIKPIITNKFNIPYEQFDNVGSLSDVENYSLNIINKYLKK